jgi:hypothetical protein
MTPPHPSQYHILPKDDPLRAVNILRAAAGLDPLSDHDDTAQEEGVSDDRSPEG